MLSQAWLQKNDHPFRFSEAWLEGGRWLHIAWLQTPKVGTKQLKGGLLEPGWELPNRPHVYMDGKHRVLGKGAIYGVLLDV